MSDTIRNAITRGNTRRAMLDTLAARRLTARERRETRRAQRREHSRELWRLLTDRE